MPRTKASQSKHNKVVEQEANGYLKNGWNVSADITNWPRPEIINKYRPDIIAERGKYTTVIEVETEESVDTPRDVLQRVAFRLWANKSKYRRFRRIIAV